MTPVEHPDLPFAGLRDRSLLAKTIPVSAGGGRRVTGWLVAVPIALVVYGFASLVIPPASPNASDATPRFFVCAAVTVALSGIFATILNRDPARGRRFEYESFVGRKNPFDPA